jgi:hypothetical protein
VQCGTAARYLPPSTACHAGTLHVRHGKPPVHQTDLRPVPAPTEPQYASCASSHAVSLGRQKYCLFASGTAPGDVSPRVPVRYIRPSISRSMPHDEYGPFHRARTRRQLQHKKAAGAREPRVGNNSGPQSRPRQNSMVVLGITVAVSTLYNTS